MPISSILVPDDGTEAADKAFDVATELAKSLNAHITLIHVIDHIEIPHTLILGNDRELIERAKKSIIRATEEGWKKRAKDKNEKLNNLNIITQENRCLIGPAADKILEYAEENKADMIVMASRRLKGISKIKALGSVARKVSESASCPVLLVH